MGKLTPSWRTSIAPWFRDQGFHIHLEQDGSNVSSNQVEHWPKTIVSFVRYYSNLWNPNDWVLVQNVKLYLEKKLILFQIIFIAMVVSIV